MMPQPAPLNMGIVGCTWNGGVPGRMARSSKLLARRGGVAVSKRRRSTNCTRSGSLPCSTASDRLSERRQGLSDDLVRPNVTRWPSIDAVVLTADAPADVLRGLATLRQAITNAPGGFAIPAMLEIVTLPVSRGVE